MLIVNRNQNISFRFLFAADGDIYDAITQAIPEDVSVSIIRGERLAGAIVMMPLSYLFSSATPDPTIYISKEANSEFVFYYKVPENIFPGIYTLIAKTAKEGIDLIVESRFEVKESAYEAFPTVPLGNRSSIVTYKPSYQDINQSNTSSIILLGHADNVKLNNPIKIKSIQNAVDILGADSNSPLLKGVFDSYSAGAKDIFICAVAPMSEYVFNISERNVSVFICFCLFLAILPEGPNACIAPPVIPPRIPPSIPSFDTRAPTSFPSSFFPNKPYRTPSTITSASPFAALSK